MRSLLRTVLVVPLVLSVGLGCNLGNLKKMQDHILNRIGYGPDAWSLARIAEIGMNGYIEEQLNPSALDDSALDAEIASLYPVENMSYKTSRVTYNEYTGNPDIGPYSPIRDATRAKLLRAVKSKKQLEQVLVDFWFNHFNVDGLAKEARWGFVTLQRDAIRAHVFGRFEQMLVAVARNPGMMDYLDNSVNFKEGYRHLGITRGINENYAREILELHTLGVDNGYTHEDIRTVARAFTGWSIATSYNIHPDGYEFYLQGHDRDPKTLFNGALVLPAGRGEEDALDVMDYLARQPATAERLVRKLCQRFISEDAPPQAVIDRAKQTYLDTDGDLREVYRVILTSAEFRGLDYARTKVKRPLHFVASLARAAGLADDALFASRLESQMMLLGEGLFRAGPPTGYPESSRFWSGEGAYIQRVKTAYQATHGEWGFDGAFTTTATLPDVVVDQLQALLLRNGIEPTTRTALVSLATGLPENARVDEVASTLFVSPDFLVH
jgi:hypothetical protein